MLIPFYITTYTYIVTLRNIWLVKEYNYKFISQCIVICNFKSILS